MSAGRWGFGTGAVAGAVIMVFALLMVDASGPLVQISVDGQAGVGMTRWITANLGHSVWPFALVLVLFAMNVSKLADLLRVQGPEQEVVELDQLSDIWIQLFIGIGVIWTAVGMRSALQVALGDPANALTDSAGSVLQDLVDGGILLALTTTIVGGVGGYLMRLGKTLFVGADLHRFYAAQAGSEMRELIDAAQRIEARLERQIDDAVVGARLREVGTGDLRP